MDTIQHQTTQQQTLQKQHMKHKSRQLIPGLIAGLHSAIVRAKDRSKKKLLIVDFKAGYPNTRTAERAACFPLADLSTSAPLTMSNNQ